ncbi:uncharacterized protein ALTATR162_LOCUS4512 [Alternaria atra]|uniref:Ankyrin n=1 Tax=Alternaria atra TaxID=119953 RepID=A0A8J2HY69_9PLEO|nr:uncharacterized protein ALTATR162_LOCUS4512 [Alternaria atra]CAG5156716.1 unnamed protein product [Alternaria atra]
MSRKTTSTLHEAASTSPANVEDHFDSLNSDLDVLSTPGSQDSTPIPVIAVAEELEHEEVIDTSKETRRLLLNYDEFHDAIKHGDFDSVKEMLDDGANIERTTDNGGTPLIIAIYKHHIDIIALLLKRGADVNWPVIDSPPIFHAVTQKEHAPQIIQLLLDYGGMLEAVAGPTHMNALHWAAVNGMIHAADFLISKGLDISRTCSRGKTPLIHAAEKGHLTIVKLLLAKGADLHGRSANDGSALMWASSQAQDEVVDYLLNEGSRVDDCDEDGLTALSVSSKLGSMAIVQLLIEKGANVNTLSTSPKHWTPAMFAANAGRAGVLQALLSHGADPKVSSGDGVTILELAIKSGHLNTVKILLEALGGPEYPKDSVALQIAIAQSKATVTSLMTTVPIMYGYIDSKPTGSEKLDWIKWVLDQGGELVKAGAMTNMLHAALAHQDVSMTAELLKLGVDANTIFCTGNTPLHIAVYVRNLELIKLLLEAGADPAKPSQDPKGLKLTPLHEAIIDWKDGCVNAMSVIDLLLRSRRCRIMEGENAQSTAFACVVRKLNHWNDKVVLEADEIVRSMLGWTDDRSDDGSTPMHVAVHYKQKGLIDALRRVGADINAKNNNGHSPLLVASRSDVEMVNFLITRCADVSAVNNHGQGALQIAAACGQVEVLEFLLGSDLADEAPLNIDAVDDAGHTPLIAAILTNHEGAALYLLERGASTHYRTSDTGRCAMHLAAQANMQRTVEKILEDSSIDNINVEDYRRYTPLTLACIYSAPAVISKLLSHGADPNIANDTTGDRPLHIALKRRSRMSPMDARHGDPALDLLNYHRIDITARDADGRTPLHLASEFHNFAATKLLLSKGVSPHYEDNRGRTPLCLCSRPDIAQALIDHGADVNHGDENGWTPLHYAVSRCWVKAFAVLRRARANMDARTRDDGLSVKERLERFGTWEDWVNAEWEYICDDVRREKMREVEMEDEL